MGYDPEPGKDEIEDRIDEDVVGDGEKAHRPLAKNKRRHGDEGVSRVEDRRRAGTR
jgi:hypothetical protein